MYCKNCGTQMDPNAAVCLNCGCAKGTGLSYCANCGQPIAPGAAVCTNCGYIINGYVDRPELFYLPKDKPSKNKK